MKHIEDDIAALEDELDDDAESIITNERYIHIATIIKGCYKKKLGKAQTRQIDKIVTNRWLGLPIFRPYHVPCLLHFHGNRRFTATDWANDGLFGDGWHLFGIGESAYSTEELMTTPPPEAVSAFLGDDFGAAEFRRRQPSCRMKRAYQPTGDTPPVDVEDERPSPSTP